MQSPFKFLDAYQKEDKDRFFGREKETAQLYNAVFSSNITLLYGASGTGKTSLVNCGLSNKFYETDWLPVFIRREQNINTALDLAIQNAFPKDQAPNKMLGSIRDKIKQLYLQHYKPIYLIFDQFEEIYILGKKAEQQEFYKTIAELLQSDLQAKVLIIMREEWIASLNEFEKVVPILFDNRLRIERMNDRNIYRVIAGNCRYVGVKIDSPKETIVTMTNNLRERNERIDLTNLQVYLDRLYQQVVAKNNGQVPNPIVFNLALVEEVGRIGAVLSDFLGEQIKSLETGLSDRGIDNPEGLPIEILFAMVTDDGTKQQVDLPAILDALPKDRNLTEADLKYCLDYFIEIKMMRQLE